jgi:hypothetical protein
MTHSVRTLSANDWVEDVLDLDGVRLEVRPPGLDGGYQNAPTQVELIEAPEGASEEERRSYPRLVSTPGDVLAQGPRFTAADDCLTSFIELANVPEGEFPGRALAFARRYGLLGLCRHREPYRHNPRCRPTEFKEDGSTWFWEPLEAWRQYSRHLGAILCVAANLQNDLPGDRRDWEAIFAVMPDPTSEAGRAAMADGRGAWTPRRSLEDVGGNRLMMSDIVTSWLRFGGVQAVMFWKPTDRVPTMLWFHVALTGVLALQLAAAVESPAYRCAGCDRPFTLPEGSRRRARNRNAYCGRAGCGRKANNRVNQRRFQERRKGQAPAVGR